MKRGKSRWEKRGNKCKESGRDNGLLIEWRREGKKETVSGISCDNPQFQHMDNWDCEWSCIDKIEKKRKG